MICFHSAFHTELIPSSSGQAHHRVFHLLVMVRSGNLLLIIMVSIPNSAAYVRCAIVCVWLLITRWNITMCAMNTKPFFRLTLLERKNQNGTRKVWQSLTQLSENWFKYKIKLSVLCVHIGNKLSNSSDCFKMYIICKEMSLMKTKMDIINNNNSTFLLTVKCYHT